MSDQQPQTVAEVRAKAKALVSRAKGDAAFRQQLESQPAATLQAAGIPTAEADLISQEFQNGDVSGFMMKECNATCDTITCIITQCANWFTDTN